MAVKAWPLELATERLVDPHHCQTAERLHLSVKTVETYRDRIRQKLALSDGTELAHYATQWMIENG